MLEEVKELYEQIIGHYENPLIYRALDDYAENMYFSCSHNDDIPLNLTTIILYEKNGKCLMDFGCIMRCFDDRQRYETNSFELKNTILISNTLHEINYDYVSKLFETELGGFYEYDINISETIIKFDNDMYFVSDKSKKKLTEAIIKGIQNTAIINEI